MGGCDIYKVIIYGQTCHRCVNNSPYSKKSCPSATNDDSVNVIGALLGFNLIFVISNTVRNMMLTISYQQLISYLKIKLFQ